MVLIKNRILLFLISLLICQQQLAKSNVFSDRLQDVKEKIDELKNNFRREMRRMFYSNYEKAEAGENYPLFALVAEAAESKTLLYACERRGLLIAKDLIEKYFVQESLQLEGILERNEPLVDLIIKRLIVESIEYGLFITENYRKRIYRLSKQSENHPGILDLTRMYFRNIINLKVKKDNAKGDIERLLERYKGSVSFIWSEKNSAATSIAINELLHKAEQLLDRREGVRILNEYQLFKKYANEAKLLTSIRKAKYKAIGIIDTDTDLESVNMNDVLLLEEIVGRDYGGIKRYLIELDTRLAEMDEEFKKSMELLLYQPQQVKETPEFLPFFALSAIAAEGEALMYADERRMLLIIKDMFDQYSTDFLRIFETSKNLLGLVVNRAIRHSIENALVANEVIRKRIFLLLISYKIMDATKRLACAYLLRLEKRKALATIFEYSEKACEDAVLAELSPEEVPNSMKSVDDLVQKAVELWSAELEAPSTIKLKFNEDLLHAIISARKEKYNKVSRPTRVKISNVRLEDVSRYEKRLLEG